MTRAWGCVLLHEMKKGAPAPAMAAAVKNCLRDQLGAASWRLRDTVERRRITLGFIMPACAAFGEIASQQVWRLKIAAHLTMLASMKRMGICVLVSLAICGGCSKPSDSYVTSRADPLEPSQAQPKLRTMKLYVGSQEMTAELALTPIQQHTGMMFRTNMEERAGMLFPLPSTQRASFYMKNCPYPLSAAYIDPEGIIQEIHDLQPFNTNPVQAAYPNIRFVLETPQGWFQRHQIGPGVAVATERGPLMQTFFDERTELP